MRSSRGATAVLAQLKALIQSNPAMSEQVQGHLPRVQMIRRAWLVTVRGRPLLHRGGRSAQLSAGGAGVIGALPREMWLQATAAGLGLPPALHHHEMAKDPDFCQLLGLAGAEFGLNGCAIGYPYRPLPQAERPGVGEVNGGCDRAELHRVAGAAGAGPERRLDRRKVTKRSERTVEVRGWRALARRR